LGEALLRQPEDDLWLRKTVKTTEESIDYFLKEFLSMPYLHRVEHSLHTRLCMILASSEHLSKKVAFFESDSITQLIHKEWKETIPRKEKHARNGNFDIAILSPKRISLSSVRNFVNGWIAPSIVIEVGLNCSLKHLRKDRDKLQNSRASKGYVIHLIRDRSIDSETIEYINDFPRETGIGIGFASFQDGFRRIKLLRDASIREENK
jgi:hypothetical protein